MKKILIIAYYFPPTAGGGVQRAAKFVKYLPGFGWKPVVLTVKNPDVDIFDESLLKDIQADTKVYKTYSFDPVRWYRARRYGLKSRLEVEGSKISSREKKSPLSAIKISHVRSFFKPFKYVLNNLILVPDDYVGWIPFAVAKGLRIIKKEKIDIIYATGKPWSSFLIAFLLNLVAKRPYILDLRDPWVLTLYGKSDVNGLKHKIERFWEKICFSYAGQIVNINEQIRNSYVQNYPSIPSNKFAFITHGFDPEDFLSINEINKADQFTVSYIGTIYPNTSPINLFKAFNSLFSEEPSLRSKIRLKFVGFVPSYVLRIIKNLGLEQVVETFGYLPHRESIQHMINSDLLLLLLNRIDSNSNAQVSTGKLFEYLASRRSILALIPNDSDAAGLIKELGAGKVIDPEDTNGIATTIREMYVKYKNDRLNSHIGNLERFNRRNLTEKLANILDKIHKESSFH
jgi:glycosyltransferase involved in cell wall biosynthesis